MTKCLHPVKITFKEIILLLLCLTIQLQAFEPIKYVNPLIGTGGHGHTFLGASVPFGAIQPGPNNIYKGWDWSSGYHITDPIIKGFSHLHLSGTGCADLGDILVMPHTGKVKTMQGSDDNPDQGYASRYNNKTQIARPDYYAVTLADYNVKVELSATERVAIHRYTFPGQNGHIIIDLENG
ncbi:MAG: glycoside hydrolase family 92 protein, partial [Bacteroidales bacterium]|nr:glycoside hydrolase family 92 protein [Bacteroidales bacterium]